MSNIVFAQSLSANYLINCKKIIQETTLWHVLKVIFALGMSMGIFSIRSFDFAIMASGRNKPITGIDVADNLQLAYLFVDCCIWLNLISRTCIELGFYK